MDTSLGRKMRRARRDKSWSQEDTARVIGVSLRTYGEWERTGDLPADRIPDIEAALGVQLGDAPVGPNGLPAGVDMGLVVDPDVWAGMTEMQRVEARAAAQVAILAKLRELGVL